MFFYAEGEEQGGGPPSDTTSPIITGSSIFSVYEGTTAVGSYSADESVTWSLSGTDSSLFSISSGGALSFSSAPSYGSPQDSGSNNVYNLDVVATDSSANSSSSSVEVTVYEAGSGDVYYDDVSLLMKFDSNIADYSTNLHTTTAVGNVSLSSTESKSGGASLLVNASGDYVTVPHDASLNLHDVSDWTVEAWVYLTGNYSRYRPIITKRDASSGVQWQFFLNVSSGYLSFYNGSFYTSTTTISSSQWVHLAFERYGGTTTFYVDGNSVYTTSGSPISGSDEVAIGAVVNSPTEFWEGYIDDVRITKGVARYTSNFTPPNFLPAIQANIIGNASPEINEGTTAVTTYSSPLSVTWSITGTDSSFFSIDSFGSLAFNSAPSHGSPQDSGNDNIYNLTVIATDAGLNTYQLPVAVTVLDATAPVITGSGSVSINEGTTAVATYTADESVSWSVTGSDSSLFQISAGGELSFISAPAFGTPQDSGSNNIYDVNVVATDLSTNANSSQLSVAVTVLDNAAPIITGDATPTHPEGATVVGTYTANEPVTWSLSGVDSSFFSIDSSGSLSFNSAPSYSSPQDSGSNNIYDVNVIATDGIALTSSLAVAVEVALADPNFSSVSLLLPMDSDFSDSSNNNQTVVTVAGNTTISSTQSKFGGASGYFDGSGDYVQYANDATLNLHDTTSFTVETWVYHTGNYSLYRPIIAKRASPGGAQYQFYLNISSGDLRFYNGSAYSFGTTVPTNQWVHLAFVGENGNTITAYINGNPISSVTAWPVSGTNDLIIGHVLNSSSEFWFGYLDDLRITKGVARYTSSFTPPTSAHPIS